MNLALVKLQQIKFYISEFNNYNEVVEKFFEKATNDIEKEYKKLEKKYKGNEETLYNLSDHYSDKYNETGRVFPNHFRVSFFNQIMSFIVFQLTEICDLHARVTGSKYRVSDLKGSDLEVCKDYLKKSANVDFAKLNTEWTFLSQCYTIRNKFVHKLGEIETSGNEFKGIKNFIDKTKLLEYKYPVRKIEDAKQVTLLISKPLVPELLKITSILFNKLLKDCLEIKKK
jgi:hypothetical protein